MSCRSCDGESNTTFMGAPWCVKCVGEFLMAPHRVEKIQAVVQVQAQIQYEWQDRMDRGFLPKQDIYKAAWLRVNG